MAFAAIGGMAGFLAAVLGLTFLDMGWVAALGLWVLGGPVGAAAALAVACFQGGAEAEHEAEIPPMRQAA